MPWKTGPAETLGDENYNLPCAQCGRPREESIVSTTSLSCWGCGAHYTYLDETFDEAMNRLWDQLERLVPMSKKAEIRMARTRAAVQQAEILDAAMRPYVTQLQRELLQEEG